LINLLSLKTKLQRFISQLAYAPRTLRLIWAAAPGWTVAWAILLVVQGLLPAANVYLTRLLVDSLVTALGAGVAWNTIQPTVFAGALIAVVMLLTQVTQGILEWVRTGQSELIGDYLTALVHEKSAAVDLAYYESPKYHDHLYQASSDLKQRPLALLESSGGFVQSCITLLTIGALLIPYGLWLPIMLIISTVPAFYAMLRFNRIYHRWWDGTTVDRRWTQYYDTMLMVDAVASEVRLFNLGAYFQSAYQQIRRRLRLERLQLTKQRGLVALGAGAFAGLMTGATISWMVWQAFLGLVTLGDVALFYQALGKGQSLLRNMLGSAGNIYNNVLFLGNLFEFLALKPQIADPPAPAPAPDHLQQGIRFRQVTFCYPGSQIPVFDHFDFEIPAGKLVAIVGVNGAGKSTLVKLLCRLYDPEEGSIELDGVDLRKLRVDELRSMITGMFQFPVHYFATAKENIAIGDFADASNQKPKIEEAARMAGAHEFISRLPYGYDTPLGKWFPHGVELSGGEWQRLALARAFFRQAPIMILDEPTSFIDSWSEIDWFDRLRKLADGRTTILITHRFTIAKRADAIHVMDKGHIIESGTHEQLLKRNGMYAQSWKEQMRESNAPTTVLLPPNGYNDERLRSESVALSK
jgi:ATP-binding cassette subfamily B protein